VNALAVAGRQSYRPRVRRLTLIVTLVAFIFSSGGQWTALQCLAWANMIREYSHMVPLAEAVRMTFSGEYPCPICKAIAAKKQSDDAKMLELAKHDKPVLAPSFQFRRRAGTEAPRFYAERETFFQFRSEPPPTPPPRLA
jgi:hypothetical protein